MIFRFIFLISLFTSTAFGAPSISSISGTVVDDNNLTISGTSFGTHALSIEWLGGASGNIESGTDGAVVSATGWSIPANDTSPNRRPRYVSDDAHSGSQSIYTKRENGTYIAYMTYDTGGADKIYFSYWANQTKGDCDQWKAWRWSETSNVTDQANNIMSSVYGGSNYNTVMCESSNPSTADCYPGNVADIYMDTSHIASTWYRIESYIETNSSAGAEDGVWLYNLYKSGSLNNATNFTTMEDRATGVTGQKRYFHLQNYFGNNCEEVVLARIYMDDIYVQTGTRARVELCNASTWTNRGHCEIQYPTAWAAGEITSTVNLGSFSSGTVYAYVVDSNGDVNSSGYALTIGSGDTAPVISNLAPSGAQSSGTEWTTLSLNTNENATCKWGDNITQPYANMPNTFNGGGTTTHDDNTTSILSDGNSYDYYVYCSDGTYTSTQGNISFSVSTPSDITDPTVTGFDITETSSTNKTVNIGTFTCTDNVAVTKYLINETVSEPASGDGGWVDAVLTTYTFGTVGAKTLYAWCMDADLNISTSLNDTVTINSAGTIGTSAILGLSDDATNAASWVDTYLNINTTNYETDDNLNTYVWPANEPANTILVQFDATVFSANLTIGTAVYKQYMHSSAGDTALNIAAYLVTNNPNLTTATGETYDGTNPWTANDVRSTAPTSPLGFGDIGTALDTVSVGRAVGYKEWDITDGVQTCVSSQDSTCTIFLSTLASEGANNSSRYFYSGNYSDSTKRPKIEITQYNTLKISFGINKIKFNGKKWVFE